MANNYQMSEEPSTIKVKKSVEFHDVHDVQSLLKSYSSRSKKRGLLFLVNNKDFKNPKTLPTRNGSEVDYKNLIDLFKQMNFEILKHENLTKQKLKEELTSIQKREDLSEFDCFFTIIMSHGGTPTDATTIFMIEDDPEDAEKKIVPNDIVEYFNASKCPQLEKKPKVFIFQACRGDKHDQRVTIHADQESSHNIQKNQTPDILLCHSTYSGYKAYRDTGLGAIYIQRICEVFMNEAHNKHVLELINMVNIKTDKEEQTPTITYASFKNLFLHPGIYEENGILKHF